MQSSTSDLRAVKITADVGGAEWGYVVVGKRGGAAPYVGYIHVERDARRCGLGTQLYAKAAATACKTFKSGLQSDEERSAAADGFWQKQVRKGRAACVAPSTRPLPHGDSPAYGRNNCEAYAFSCPAPKDLSRRGRRKRRR